MIDFDAISPEDLFVGCDHPIPFSEFVQLAREKGVFALRSKDGINYLYPMETMELINMDGDPIGADELEDLIPCTFIRMHTSHFGDSYIIDSWMPVQNVLDMCAKKSNILETALDTVSVNC